MVALTVATPTRGVSALFNKLAIVVTKRSGTIVSPINHSSNMALSQNCQPIETLRIYHFEEHSPSQGKEMKRMIQLSALTVGLGGVVLIGGCGSDDADPLVGLVARFGEVTALLGTSAGLKDAKVPAIFDDAYKDAGYVKSALVADLQAESAALAANPDQSLFPMAAFKDVTVTGCDNNICTLNGKLVNTDVDTTEASFTTQVKSVNGEYYFYGDQKAS